MIEDDFAFEPRFCLAVGAFVPASVVFVLTWSFCTAGIYFSRVQLEMAEKEATVYIVDLGESMGRKHQGREASDLEWAMQYVWEKITSTVGLYVLQLGRNNV